MPDIRTRCPACGSPKWAVLTSCERCGDAHCDRCPGAQVIAGRSLFCGTCLQEIETVIRGDFDAVAEELAAEVLRRLDEMFTNPEMTDPDVMAEWKLCADVPLTLEQSRAYLRYTEGLVH